MRTAHRASERSVIVEHLLYENLMFHHRRRKAIRAGVFIDPDRPILNMYIPGWWFETCFMFPNSWDDDPI